MNDPKFNESLGRNAQIEDSIAWPDGVAGVFIARTTIDGEDTLVVRCWCPNIRGAFAEFHFRSVERPDAIKCYHAIIYGISKLCLHERRVELTAQEFALRLESWARDLSRDRAIGKAGLVPPDVRWQM